VLKGKFREKKGDGSGRRLTVETVGMQKRLNVETSGGRKVPHTTMKMDGYQREDCEKGTTASG